LAGSVEHPLTADELGADFVLEKSWRHGHLPAVFSEPDPEAYLKSYVQTYMREEVLQEGLTRNIGAFARFLEAASFSQGSVLNIAEVARECAVERKVVEGYFQILEDILLEKPSSPTTPRRRATFSIAAESRFLPKISLGCRWIMPCAICRPCWPERGKGGHPEFAGSPCQVRRIDVPKNN
jgi:hypothetical protein